MRRFPTSLLTIVILAVAACADVNHSPTLDPIGDQRITVGQELAVELAARDPDGDTLTFSMTDAPKGARLDQAPVPTFRWAPLISQVDPGGRTYAITLRADDGRGGIAEQVLHVTAYPEGGVPAFLNPSGFVINLAYETRVAFLIEVKDDDTDAGDMMLRLVAGIEGAEFQLINGKSASFYWKPTPEQIAESSYWSIVVGADDGVHAEVQQEISIILLNAAAGHCEGTPPSVQHVPLGDAHGSGAYEVAATAVDAETLVSSMTLHWTKGDDVPDEAMQKVPMTLDGDTWRAVIPNAGLAGSKTALLRYAVVARDNDDITGTACDHEGRSPKAGTHRFLAYAPGTDGVCADDAYEPNDDPSSAAKLDPGTFDALRACGGDPDWFATTVGAGQTVKVRAAWEPSHGALDVRLRDAGGTILDDALGTPGGVLSWGPATKTTTVLIEAAAADGAALSWSLDLEVDTTSCTDDALEPNDGPDDARPLAVGLTSDLVICPDDSDWFAIDVAQGKSLTAAVLFSQAEGDLDAVLYAPDGVTAVASSETETDDEVISYTVPAGGTYLLEVRSFQGAANVYDVAIALVDPGEVCSEDILAPNQDMDHAVTLPAAVWEGLTLCPGTSDWYRYGLNGGETLLAAADTASDGVSIRIRDAQGKELGDHGVDEQGAWAQTVIPGKGNYLIEVASTGASPAPYTLAIAAKDAPGACVNDRFEPNNVLDVATLFEAGVITRGKLCAKDQDIYRIEGGAFESVTLWALFQHASGDIDMDLLDAEGKVVAQSKGATDDELIELLLPAGGTYFVRVTGKDVTDNAYDLVFFIEN